MPKIGRILSCAELDDLIQENSSEVYRCEECKKCFASKASQMRHQKRHGRTYPCEQCEKTFSSKHGVKKPSNVINVAKRIHKSLD